MTATPVKGFRTAGVHCGLKLEEKDLAIVASERPCAAAGVFTTNRVRAAPVTYDEAILAARQPVRAVVANAGNANACTGEQGEADTRAMAAQAADALGCDATEVLVLSTGVIGVPMPMETVLRGIDEAAGAMRVHGWNDAAVAITTTDTHPKLASVTTEAGYTVTGMAKGAGMIAPNMATMLGVIATDAEVAANDLQGALGRAIEVSFNRIVVDGDMSTNDTVLLLANGASGVAVGEADPAFEAALQAVCIELARSIVRDGEGATKFVTLEVSGAPDGPAAQAVARAIATSPLCKTAFYGGDPNWGRILAAAGRSGVDVDPGVMALWLLPNDGEAIQLVAAGRPTAYAEAQAIAVMQGPEWGLRLELGLGEVTTTVWTCDLSHEYVTINGHYRT